MAFGAVNPGSNPGGAISKTMIKSRVEGLDFADGYTRKFNAYATNLREYNRLVEERLTSQNKGKAELEIKIAWARHIAERSLEAMITIMEELTSRKPQAS